MNVKNKTYEELRSYAREKGIKYIAIDVDNRIVGFSDDIYHIFCRNKRGHDITFLTFDKIDVDKMKNKEK